MRIGLAPPIEAELLLTTRCNMHCPHCCANANANNTIGKNTDLDTSVWLDVTNQLIAMGVQTFTLAGGEPTLHEGFMTLVKRINEAGLYCAITTNAFFIDDLFVQQLLSYELDKSKISFHISIDGLESKHDAFRKTPGAFKNAINAMNLLNNVGLTACCNFMLTSQSIAEFDNLEKIINKAGCKSINIGQCAPVGRNDIDISYDEWSKFFRTTTDKQKGKKYNCSTRCMTHGIWQLYLPLLNNVDDAYTIWGKKSEVTEDCKTCPAGVFTIAIDGNGWVYPCDLMTSFKELRCGNILNNKLIDIWNDSPVLHDLRSVNYKNIKPCSTCFMAEDCHSGCRGATFGLTKSLEAPDIRCPMVRSFASPKYPVYLGHDTTILQNKEYKPIDTDKKLVVTINIFNTEIRLISYGHSFIAKERRRGNSIMIINQFGFQILKLVEKGLQFDRIISIFSGKNNTISTKLEKDIRAFFMEMIIKKVVPLHEVKRYLSLQETTVNKQTNITDDVLSPIIYQKVDSNYLVYITSISNIMLLNKTGLKIAQLYLDGVRKDEIVQCLHKDYKDCCEEQLMNDINEFLEHSKLSTKT